MGRTNPPLAAPVLLSFALAAAFAIAADGGPVALAAWFQAATGPRFYPDDPVWVDDDRAFDAAKALATATGDIYDFVEHTFMPPGERVDRPALNVNTLDEVPDSSWFTNRIGRQRLSREELVRGPDRRARPDIQDWPIVAGKAEGVQPGYRVQDPEKHLWQIEFDPPAHPEMASGAEVIGTAIYHALGYHVVEVYVTDVDPAKIRIAPNARMRVVTAPKRRPLVRAGGPQRGAGPRRAPSRRPRPRPRQPLRRGIAARQLPLRRPAPGRSQRRLPARAPARAARQPRLRRLAEPRRLARPEQPRHARARRRQGVGQALHVRLRVDHGQRHGVRAEAARRQRVHLRPQAGPAHRPDLRPVLQAVDHVPLSGRAGVGRPLRGDAVQARGVEAGVPEPGLPEHAAGGRLLGRAAGGALHARGRRGHRRQGRVLGSGRHRLRHEGAARAAPQGPRDVAERRSRRWSSRPSSTACCTP